MSINILAMVTRYPRFQNIRRFLQLAETDSCDSWQNFSIIIWKYQAKQRFNSEKFYENSKSWENYVFRFVTTSRAKNLFGQDTAKINTRHVLCDLNHWNSSFTCECWSSNVWWCKKSKHYYQLKNAAFLN